MHISTFLLLATLSAAPGQETTEDRMGNAREKISEAWQRRSESVKAGTMEWEYADEPFGRFETYWIPKTPTTARKIQGQLQLTPKAIRYHSHSFEYPVLGYSKATILSEREYFRSHLLSHFQKPGVDERKLLPYTITVTPEPVIHYWQDDAIENREYPRAVTLPSQAISSYLALAEACGFASDSHSHDSGLPSPIIHQINTLPALLSFRSAFFDKRLAGGLEDVEILPSENDPGCFQLVLDSPVRASEEKVPQWRLLVDPTIDFSVRRLLGSLDGKAFIQCDISYDEYENKHWIPRQWAIQVFGDGDPSYVRQFVTANRTSISLEETGSSSLEEMNDTLPPKTWIIDVASGKQSLVLEDGSSWELRNSLMSGISYEQALAQSQGEGPRTAMAGASWMTPRRIVSSLTRWPGMALPLLVIGSGMFMAIRYFSPTMKADSEESLPSVGRGQEMPSGGHPDAAD
ncbi:hypothetical protein [Blastopirellula marina]|uniref:Uncharacterized protein n=1 Tax=Blastopirellula marina TaxID=124 RepID=A0A2S8GM16_9BACT|nr:hypothetical protein [Blastopirellula marina]PQO45486.1 hypothetical protein C5Y93_13625 [Blastopirellula marina]